MSEEVLVHIPPPGFPPTPGTGDLVSELSRRVRGEVRFDSQARALYATDASNYRQPPIGVVVPETIEDVVETVLVCHERGLPLVPRGGGTSLAGQAANRAVVIDTTRSLDRVNWIDPDRRLASVQPGCILDDLRAAAVPHGLTFGPDPATHNRCTIGGMIGNNACGVHAQMSGCVADNVEELDVLTADGTRLRIGRTSEQEIDRIVAKGGRRGELYRGLRELRDEHLEVLRQGFPDLPRRVSGYNLDALLPENGFDLAGALVGTEGTCAIVLEAVVRLVPAPPSTALLVLGFPDVYEAADAVPRVVEARPTGLEGLDSLLVDFMRRKGLHLDDLPLLPEGSGWLLVEMGGQTRDEAAERAHELRGSLSEGEWPVGSVITDPGEVERVWAVRESGLGGTARVPGEDDTHPGWEDSAVPPHRLGPYLRELRTLLDEHGYSGSFYGHFGQGCLHTRIDFDLESAAGVERFRRFLEDAADLVVSHGGSLSGEHGDGQARGELLDRMYGPELVEAFRRFKAVWDPDGRMNPGKVVDPLPLDSDLRLGPGYAPSHPDTHFAFPHDRGSLARAAERCVGVGLCRRDDEAGTMCPSYMVTHEERHSTRGRAHLLSEMMRGELIEDGWRSEEVREALDLCLACKGCKGDCPVDVDIATYKAEFMAHHYAGRLRPLASYSMGLVHIWARLASRVAGLVNALTAVPPVAALAKRAGGIAPQRPLPRLATQTLVSWLRARPRPEGWEERPPVLLWPDTFTNFLDPEPGKAAVRVLERCGFRVQIPDSPLCCGRPLYDPGFLRMARRRLERILDELRDDIRAGVPLVGIEPSCVAVFRDELVEMLPDDRDARRLSSQSHTLAEFLDRHPPRDGLGRADLAAILQTHCHQKSVMHDHADNRVLAALGVQVIDPEAGCCGMAGAFGFEQGEKHEVSVAAAERKLLPAIREAGDEVLVVADGFSCRTQIGHLSGRRALHLAELVDAAQAGDPGRLLGDRAPREPDAVPRRVLAASAAAAGLLGLVVRRLVRQ